MSNNIFGFYNLNGEDSDQDQAGNNGPNPLRSMTRNLIASDPRKETYWDMLRLILCPRFRFFSFTVISILIWALVFILEIFSSGLQIPGSFLQVDTSGPLMENFSRNSQMIHDESKYYQLFTALWIHLDAIHIFSNSISQMIFGSLIEFLIGTQTMALFFIGSGIIGNFFSTAIDHYGVSAGASSGLFGEIGALLGFLILNWERMETQREQRCMLLFFVIMIIFLNFLWSSSSVDVYGHLGGLIAGIGLGMFALPSSGSNYEKMIKTGGAVFFAGFVGITLLIYFVSSWS